MVMSAAAVATSAEVNLGRGIGRGFRRKAYNKQVDKYIYNISSCDKSRGERIEF